MARSFSFDKMIILAIALISSFAFAMRAHAMPRPADNPAPVTPIHASAIQVEPIQADEVKLPAEFQMAMYEHVVEEIGKTNRFQHVYRDGDHDAASAPDLVTLHCTVTGFKQGSAEERQVTSVAGKTSIKVHLVFTDKDGKTLFNNDVEGKVQFFGENLRATYNFSKRVATVVKTDFTPAAPKK
jgi:hypothetical protein